MLNKIEKTQNGYFLVTGDGQRMVCKEWYEKSKDRWHIVLPKDNPTGRTYITKQLVDESPNGIYGFENRTEPPRELGGNSWKSRLTPEELEEINQLQARYEEIKKVAMERKPRELSPEEKLQQEIEKLAKKYEILTGKKYGQ